MFNKSIKRVVVAYTTASIRKSARFVPLYTDEALSALGLSPTASVDDAKKAFRALIMIHHPDRGGDHEKALKIIEAWTQLKEGTTIDRVRPTSRPQPTYTQPPKPPYTPPKPPYTPPKPRPTQNRSHGAMSWMDAERVTGGKSAPISKDAMRIYDMVRRANGSNTKLMALAVQMANAIQDVDKALRRGRAAEEFEFSYKDNVTRQDMVEIAQPFYNKAIKLSGGFV